MIDEKLRVSYSQFSMWNQCKWRWKLNYVDKLRRHEPNISMMFGSSMHDTLQEFLTIAYNKSGREANDLDLNDLLKDRMKYHFGVAQKANKGTPPCTKNEMIEHYSDGIEILNWFKKNRKNYFGLKGFELFGVEVPISMQIRPGINMVGFIDVVIKDKVRKKYRIIDFKTSTHGWNKNQKGDDNKTSQVILYKKYFSEQYKVPMENIDVEFIILKRKLYENTEYTQRRLQSIKPAHGKVTVNKVAKKFDEFLNECFTTTGDYIDGKEYKKEASEYNCKYCEFKDDLTLCDKNGIKLKSG